MIRNQKFIIFILVAILMSNTIILSADTGKAGPAKNLNIINVSANEPESLDPQIATSNAAMDITSRIMEGLMRRSGKDILPGIASRYEVSKDGLTYTFFLRDAFWTDGKPVTANDFAYGWKRALDPKTASEYAFSMYYIKNGEKYNVGTAAENQLGIKVINDKTLQVVLESATPYFIDLTTTMTYLPARKDIVENFKDKYFDSAEQIVSNGPFKLTEWAHNDYITVVKNPTYWNEKKVKIDIINSYIYSNTGDMVEAYLNGDIDVASLMSYKGSDIPKGESINYFTGAAFYLQFNNSDKDGIMTNMNIRKALSLSINRQEFINGSSTVNAAPALSLVVPEIIPGKSKTFREEAGNIIKDNDIKTAKLALTLGLKQLKLKKLPVLKLLVGDTDTSIKQAEVLAQMWKKNLGIDIKIESAAFGDRLNRMNNNSYQMAIAGWAPDYYDAMTYLEMFDSNAALNNFGYKNVEFNNLIKSIKKEMNKSNRIELLKKAEKKIIGDYVIAPLYNKYSTVAIKPYIKNLPISAAGALFDFTFTELVESGKILKSSDAKFSMKVNPYWTEGDFDFFGISGTDLLITDSIQEAAGAVIIYNTTEVMSNIDTYYNMLVTELKGANINANIFEKTNLLVSGLPAVKFKFTTAVLGSEMTFYYTLIGTPNKIYSVMFWTETTQFEQRKPEFEKILQSIIIIK